MPQKARPACNSRNVTSSLGAKSSFQCRKRQGPHAIPSSGSREIRGLKSRFSKTSAVFPSKCRFRKKTRSDFLLKNPRNPCYHWARSVHGKTQKPPLFWGLRRFLDSKNIIRKRICQQEVVFFPCPATLPTQKKPQDAGWHPATSLLPTFKAKSANTLRAHRGHFAGRRRRRSASRRSSGSSFSSAA